MSELKRGHGLGKLRVRRAPRVLLAVGLKGTACNVKRWLRAETMAERAAALAEVSVCAASEACQALWLSLARRSR